MTTFHLTMYKIILYSSDPSSSKVELGVELPRRLIYSPFRSIVIILNFWTLYNILFYQNCRFKFQTKSKHYQLDFTERERAEVDMLVT